MSKSKHRFKRRSNAALQLRRARSWLRGEDRKKVREVAQQKAHKVNVALKETGLPTTWETARTTRAEMRTHDPAVQQRRRGHEASERKHSHA